MHDIMAVDCDKVMFLKVKPEVSTFGSPHESLLKDAKSENSPVKKSNITLSYQNNENNTTGRQIKAQSNEATEERQRTGRYLAIGVTLIMLFIAFYHTLLRHATVLAGLLAPAIIMLLYILWLFYFAKKKKTQVSAV